MKPTNQPRSPAPNPERVEGLRLIRHHPGLYLALALYLVLALAYFFIVPIFEGPDEWTHTGHVTYIAQGNGLPVMLPGQGIWGGQQPPLYFAIGALLIQPFELDGVNDYAETNKNPHRSLGYALDPGNKNNYLHTPAENFPYRGLSLTVHILRLYSMLFGLIALIFTYLTAWEIYDDSSSSPQPTSNSQHRKWFAAAVVCFMACQPMFVFITSLVANEPANMAFSAIGLWLAQRYALRGPSQDWKRAAALGIVLGLISLSKMTGLSFGLVVVVVMLQAAIATRKQSGAARLLWRDGFIIGLLFLAVGGWWYGRNYQLYGDFFQQGLYKIYFGVDPQPLTLAEFLYTLSTSEVSFWATFGWLNIVAPEWVYSFYRIISRVGLIGVGLAVILQAIWWKVGRLKGWKVGRNSPSPANSSPSAPRPLTRIGVNLPPPKGGESEPIPPSGGLGGQKSDLKSTHIPPTRHVPPLLIHLLFPPVLAFSLTRLVAIEGGLQGRQLLPALGSAAIVIVWGWWLLTPNRLRRPLLAGLGAIFLGLAVWLPFGVVAPNYIPPPLLTEADLPTDLPRLDWRYNDQIKLIGVQVEAESVHPGQRLPVTAYWQALQPMETNYSVFVHLIGRGYHNAGQFNTYPGLGLRPTRSLEPGQIVKDTYPVLVNGGSEAPTRLLVNLGLFDIDEPGRPGIQPFAPDDSQPSPTVGQLKLLPNEWPTYQEGSPVAEFGDHIRLAAVAIEQCQQDHNDCRIIFTWLAQGQPSTDYTIFIQLWPENPATGESFYGFDSPPLNNDYPTGLWQAGEVIVDAHPLDLSTLLPGEYWVLSGLYDPSSGNRLPVTVSGKVMSDGAVELGTIQINE